VVLELMATQEVSAATVMDADSETPETPVVQDQSATTGLWAPLAMEEV